MHNVAVQILSRPQKCTDFALASLPDDLEYLFFHPLGAVCAPFSNPLEDDLLNLAACQLYPDILRKSFEFADCKEKKRRSSTKTVFLML